MANAFTVAKVFGPFSGLGTVVWQERITDDLLRASKVPTNATTVDIIMTVSDPVSVSDSNSYGVGYENAGLAVNGPGEYRDGKPYALRGIPVKKGDVLFIAGNLSASAVKVSIESPGAVLPNEIVGKSGAEAFGEHFGKSLGLGTVLLLAGIFVFLQAKKAVS